jgi:Na+/H+-dicarboxylate symporter
MSEMANIILRFGPIAVFVLSLQFGSRLGTTAAGATAVYGLIVMLACAVVGVLCYPAVRIFAGMPLATFARAAARGQTVAAASRSSMAALPAIVEGAEKDLGIKPSVARSVVPLAAGLFSVGTVVVQTAAVLALCHLYKVELSATGILSLVLASAYMSLNIPRVPGGAAIAMTPVLLAYKIPLEGLGVVLILDVLADFVANAVNVTAHLAGTCIVARHVGAVSTSQAAAPG